MIKMEPLSARSERSNLHGDELFDSSNQMQETNVEIVISWKISSRSRKRFTTPSFAKEPPTRLIDSNEQTDVVALELKKKETDVQFLIGFADELFAFKEANMRKRLAKNESKIREIFKSQGCDYEKIMKSQLIPKNDPL